MTADLTTIVQAQSETERSLRAHCLLGDALALRDADGALIWFTPTHWVLAGQEATARLNFLYRTAGHASALSIYVGYVPIAMKAALHQARAENNPVAAEHRWGPIAARVMRFEPMSVAAEFSTTIMPFLSRHGVVAARRNIHPCHIIDRLLVRNRDLASERLERMLSKSTENRISRTA